MRDLSGEELVAVATMIGVLLCYDRDIVDINALSSFINLISCSMDTISSRREQLEDKYKDNKDSDDKTKQNS